MSDSDPKHEPEKYVEAATVPVIAEELQAGVRAVKTGAVRVTKTVQEHEEVLEQPLLAEHVEVRRVVKNQVVDGPLPTRTTGDTIIVPVVREMLKVEKQFVLTEELHITKRAVEELHEQKVTLRSEEAKVQRFDARGNPIELPDVRSPDSEREQPARTAPRRLSPKERALAREAPRRPRKSILSDD
jgi:uncharacterized protein (TIGR02271 family)